MLLSSAKNNKFNKHQRDALGIKEDEEAGGSGGAAEVDDDTDFMSDTEMHSLTEDSSC